ncbi:MAG: hypothetical protein RMN53_04280 [Anaerolineae bacterium]|nr:hypothetical protein [Anaerolineae bacterium]
MPNGLQQYIKLESRLVLLAWLNRLFGYSSNRELLEKSNRGRTEKITLRYFQHLAALYTEIILDRLFNCKGLATCAGQVGTNLIGSGKPFTIRR